MYGIFWFGAIFWIKNYSSREILMCELERNSDYSREGWERLFPRLSSWSEVLSPRAGVCLLAVSWGRDGPARLAAPSGPPQHRFPSAWWEDGFSQAQSRAVWSWHIPCGNSKPLSTALSFSLQPRTGEAASWVVLTFINWVGPGEPFGLGQASRPRSLPGNSI